MQKIAYSCALGLIWLCAGCGVRLGLETGSGDTDAVGDSDVQDTGGLVETGSWADSDVDSGDTDPPDVDSGIEDSGDADTDPPDTDPPEDDSGDFDSGDTDVPVDTDDPGDTDVCDWDDVCIQWIDPFSLGIQDCNGICGPLSWLGDGTCDDGGFSGVDFDCAGHQHDGGDCPP